MIFKSYMYGHAAETYCFGNDGRLIVSTCFVGNEFQRGEVFAMYSKRF